MSENQQEETPAVYAHAQVAAVGAGVGADEEPGQPDQEDQEEDDDGMD